MFLRNDGEPGGGGFKSQLGTDVFVCEWRGISVVRMRTYASKLLCLLMSYIPSEDNETFSPHPSTPGSTHAPQVLPNSTAPPGDMVAKNRTAGAAGFRSDNARQELARLKAPANQLLAKDRTSCSLRGSKPPTPPRRCTGNIFASTPCFWSACRQGSAPDGQLARWICRTTWVLSLCHNMLILLFIFI